MKKRLVLCWMLLLSCFAFGYTTIEKVNGVEYRFEYKDAPTRALSISHFTTEIMLKLGLADHMIGTAFLEEEIDPSIKKEYQKVPVVAEKWPSIEKVILLHPDFVTGWEVAFKKGVDSKQLAKHGIPFFVPESSMSFDANLDTLFEDYRRFGKIFGREKIVEGYIAEEKARVEQIQKNIANKKEFTYFLYDSGTDKAFTVFEGFTTNLLSLINGRNILSGKGVKKTWGQCSWEDVVIGNPDYFIIVDYSVGIREETDSDSKIAMIRNNPLLKNLDAVKNNKFIRVKLSEICPGIRNVDFFEKVAKKVYNLD